MGAKLKPVELNFKFGKMYKFQTKKDHIIHLTMSEDDAWDCSIPAQQVLLDLSVRDCTLLTFRIRSFVLFTVTEISPPTRKENRKDKIIFFLCGLHFGQWLPIILASGPHWMMIHVVQLVYFLELEGAGVYRCSCKSAFFIVPLLCFFGVTHLRRL